MRSAGEATRDRILAAGKEEFARYGLAGARINRIATDARAGCRFRVRPTSADKALMLGIGPWEIALVLLFVVVPVAAVGRMFGARRALLGSKGWRALDAGGEDLTSARRQF